MPYSTDGITTRLLAFADAGRLVDNVDVPLTAEVTPTRDLQRPSGRRALVATLTRTSPAGQLTLELPVTDQDGWRLLDGREVVLGTGEHSHLYDVVLSVTEGTSRRTIAKVDRMPLPAGDGPLQFADTVSVSNEGLTYRVPIVGGGGSSEPGKDGASAYELAVATGYVGTLPEWLDSLHGEDGDTPEPAEDGAPGQSAYELAVAAGFTGTPQQWLESLHGTDGTDGDDGAPAPVPPAALTHDNTHVPGGSLDRWAAARDRALAGDELGEVVLFGDSTMWGQVTNQTNVETGEGRYPIPQAVRALAVADGFPDGGQGVAGDRSGAGQGGVLDPLPLVQSTVGTWGGGYYSPQWQYGITNQSNAVGDELTVQLRVPSDGGSVRINHTVGVADNVAAWSYRLDDAEAVQVPAGSNGRWHRTIALTGLSAGLHTLTIRMESAGAGKAGDEWTFEALGANGLVFHNQSVAGSQAQVRWQHTGFYREAYMLGYYNDTAVRGDSAPYLAAGARDNTVRNPVLAVFALGINDQQFVSGNDLAAVQLAADKVALAVGAFAETVRDVCDGVVVLPHLAFANQPNLAGVFRQRIAGVAAAYGLAVVDWQAPLGSNRTAFTRYGGGVHLNRDGYDAQAEHLWSVLAAA